MTKKGTKKRSIQKRKPDYVLCKCTICKRDQNGYKIVSKATRTQHRIKERKFFSSPESLEGENRRLKDLEEENINLNGLEEDINLNGFEEEATISEEDNIQVVFSDHTDSIHLSIMAEETIISEEHDTQAFFASMLSDDTDSSQSGSQGDDFKCLMICLFLIINKTYFFQIMLLILKYNYLPVLAKHYVC